MPVPQPVDFWKYTADILNRMRPGGGGVLCTVADRSGKQNLLTLGWGQIGPSFHRNPIFCIAVAPPRFSWQFLEEVAEFVIGLPDDSLRKAVNLCGTKSGRDMDKFKESNLTPIPSSHVSPPSITECSINIECRIYTKVSPPHMLLTPKHREAPLENQHTIYFAEVLGTYKY
ncbi:MAG: flavin reductase family protein [Spirochaetales bacterium]|jgi:flavin reductase (DIM6/NTAB) family NADH-FMN oxidoreductase RutF|nr:flavin reductase family protein [Spirochaetales bacterium]